MVALGLDAAARAAVAALPYRADGDHALALVEPVEDLPSHVVAAPAAELGGRARRPSSAAELGVRAVERLLARIRGGAVEARQELVPYRLSWGGA